MASDDAVRATNDDAAQCKRFAVEKGYWQDPFITLLTQRSQNKHAPEISRGYYARVMAMRTLLQKFIKVCTFQTFTEIVLQIHSVPKDNFRVRSIFITNLGFKLFFSMFSEHHTCF